MKIWIHFKAKYQETETNFNKKMGLYLRPKVVGINKKMGLGLRAKIMKINKKMGLGLDLRAKLKMSHKKMGLRAKVMMSNKKMGLRAKVMMGLISQFLKLKLNLMILINTGGIEVLLGVCTRFIIQFF